MIILLISGRRRKHKLEHVRRCPVSFKNLWIQKQAHFDLGRNSSLKIFCLVPITLNHWLPQKSSSGGVLELSVPEVPLFLSCTAQQHKGHVKFISKVRSALFGFIHWPNSDITKADATGLTHATTEFFSKSYYYKVKSTSVLSPWALVIAQHQLSLSDDGLMGGRSSEFGSSALMHIHEYMNSWGVLSFLSWHDNTSFPMENVSSCYSLKISF